MTFLVIWMHLAGGINSLTIQNTMPLSCESMAAGMSQAQGVTHIECQRDVVRIAQYIEKGECDLSLSGDYVRSYMCRKPRS